MASTEKVNKPVEPSPTKPLLGHEGKTPNLFTPEFATRLEGVEHWDGVSLRLVGHFEATVYRVTLNLLAWPG